MDKKNKNLFAVIDLEATCNKDDLEPAVPLSDMETIEIGIVIIDLDTQSIISTFESKVRPVFISNVTPFCTEPTGISKEDLEQEPGFKDAMRHVDEWLLGFTHKKVPWGSWGEFDGDLIKQDCLKHSSMQRPLPVEYLGAHVKMKKCSRSRKRFASTRD